MLATYMRRMRNNNLEILDCGFLLSPVITVHIFFCSELLVVHLLQGPEGPAGPQGAEGPAVSLYYHNVF